jgi:hypothetical protein
MAVAADPDKRSFRQPPRLHRCQPFIKFQGRASDIGVSGARHLKALPLVKSGGPGFRLTDHATRRDAPIIARRRGAHAQIAGLDVPAPFYFGFCHLQATGQPRTERNRETWHDGSDKLREEDHQWIS